MRPGGEYFAGLSVEECAEMIVTDPHEVQEIKNSIIEGKELLRYGKDASGGALSTGRRFAIRRSIMNSQEKIGEEIKVSTNEKD